MGEREEDCERRGEEGVDGVEGRRRHRHHSAACHCLSKFVLSKLNCSTRSLALVFQQQVEMRPGLQDSGRLLKITNELLIKMQKWVLFSQRPCGGSDGLSMSGQDCLCIVQHVL